jgi:hypothetical protein
MDSRLSQLMVARDSELMRGVFQRHLRPLVGQAYQVRECQIYRIQPHRGTSCMLQYTLRLVEPSSGSEWRLWVVGSIYAGGRTRQIFEKLQRSDLGQEIPDTSSTFAPFSYIPDLEMLVQVFPCDRLLLALPLLMTGPLRELEPLLIAQFGSGDWQVEAWNIEPVRYVAETRATLRLTVRAQDAVTGRTEEKRFYAKVYRNERKGERTYQALRELWDSASAGGLGLTVGRPIAYLSGLRTLVQEEAPGTPLEDILFHENEAIPEVRKVARALASLHLASGWDTARCHHPGDEVTKLQRKGEILRWACPHLGPEIEKVVGAVAAGLKEAPLVLTHGDLKPEHILLDGDRLTLLDLDAFARADPILDVAKILAELVFMPLRSSLPPDHARAVARTFVGEYFARVPETWRTRLSLHYAGAVLKVAVGFFRRQEPSWSDKIETLLKEAEDSLAGRVW